MGLDTEPAGQTEPQQAPEPESEPMPAPVLRPLAPPIPVPGRHASRRTGIATHHRFRLTAWQISAVAVLAAIGLGIACWTIASAEPDEVSLAPLGGSTATSPTESGASAALAIPSASADDLGASQVSGNGSGDVVVDVAGKVRRPGIVVLPAGSRVTDAVKAAGGAKPGTDLSSLNLARVLVDGEQIVVGQAGLAPGSATSVGTPAPGSTPGALVSLNTADQAALESLPEVGPVTAQAIITWRSEHGGFTTIDELLEIDGIGPATLEKITPYVTL